MPISTFSLVTAILGTLLLLFALLDLLSEKSVFFDILGMFIGGARVKSYADTKEACRFKNPFKYHLILVLEVIGGCSLWALSISRFLEQ